MIAVDNGRVFLDRHGKKYAVWVQCPHCGPTPPLTEIIPHVVSREPITQLTLGPAKKLRCSTCRRTGESREALVPDRKTEGKCGSRCWNGKLICACVCEGKCHGEGECYCEKVADARKGG